MNGIHHHHRINKNEGLHFNSNNSNNSNNNIRMTEWKVGSIARVKRSNHAKAYYYGKAMIATLQKDEDNDPSTSETVDLIWEPVTPQPLADFSPFEKKTTINDFLVTPRISEQEIIEGIGASGSCGREAIVPLRELSPLMEFEKSSSTAENDNDVGVLKERGDALLKAGDASAAVPYYEAALLLSSRNAAECPSIGSSIILRTKDGYLKVAEIDCVDDGADEDSRRRLLLDVTLVETGEEMEISNAATVLGVLETDGDERSQERILLNLSRCLHQLAAVDESKHRPKYLKAAVMSCSLAIVLAEFHGKAEGPDVGARIIKSKRTIQSALHLRAKAYIFLFKWPHAKKDAKRLIKEGGEEKGKSLLVNIDKRKEVQMKKDKKLAKAVTMLVRDVMSDADSAPRSSRNDDEGGGRGAKSAVSQERDLGREEKGTTRSQSRIKLASSSSQSLTVSVAISVALAVVAVLVQQMITER